MESGSTTAAAQPTELDGRVASQQELDHARAIARLLEAVASEPSADAALRLHDLAEVLLYPLLDGAGALTAIRAAQARTRSFAMARTHRRAAVQLGSDEELLVALEAEARLAPTAAQRAALESHRGVLLELTLDNAAAAKRAYEAALEQSAGHVDAHFGLMRLALGEGDSATAAKHVLGLAAACEKAAVRAELLLFAARLTERAGGAQDARGIAAQAAAHDRDSPSAVFLRERLLDLGDDARAVCDNTVVAIEAGLITPAAGWLEVGLLAKYALADFTLAARALEAASTAGDDGAARCARAELVEVWAAQGRTADAIVVASELAQSAKEPLEQAIAFTELGRLHEAMVKNSDQHDEVEAAAFAYRNAIEAVPSYLPALEGAGRTHAKLNDRERQVWAHVSEAEQAVSSMDRAVALRRAAELLLREDEGAVQGLALLERAWAAAPGHEGIFATLERVLRRTQAWPRLRALYEDELGRVTSPARRARLLMRLATLCSERLHDTARAVAAYQEVAASPATARDLAMAELERVFEEVGDLGALEAALASVSETTTDPAQLASLEERLAELREAQGDSTGALELYRRAVGRVPTTHTVLASAGRAFARAQDWPSLLSLYDRTVREGSPTEKVTYGYKAGMLLAFAMGDPPSGIARLEGVIAESPQHAPALLALATLYARAKRFGELAPILAALPSTPHLRIRRAIATELSNRPEEALQLWRSLAEEGVAMAHRAQARLLAKLSRWSELASLYRDAAEVEPDPIRAVHARWRAAELWAERCNERARALELSTQLPPAAVFVLTCGHSPAEASAELGRVADADLEPTLRSAILGELAVRGRRGPEGAEAIEHWASASPQNAAASLYDEERCDVRGDRFGLIERLRMRLRAVDADEESQARTAARLATLLQEVGSAREAVDTIEQAASSAFVPLPSLLALVRLYAELGDRERTQTALQHLSEALPEGPARAYCLRRLARAYEAAGDNERAAAAFDWALRTDARDFESLRSLAALADDSDAARVVAPLLRAWESEPAGPQRVQIGVAAAVRLVRLGRYDSARDCLQRVLADSPQSLSALLTLAELEQRAERWDDAVIALRRVSEHAEAEPVVVQEALQRLVTAYLGPVANAEAARATSLRLCEVTHNDVASLALAVRAAELAEAHEDVARLLHQLIANPGVAEDERAGYQLSLATHLDAQHGDSLAAIDVLGSIRLPSRRREAVERLMALGEKTNRWDLAASALEDTLDRHVDLDSAWEIAIRTRLAALLDGPLERRDAAAKQYERIVELDPKQLPALLRLAELVSTDPEKAIVHQRALLEADPTRLATYRALRELSLKVGDEDTAFLVEAILEGAGIADEEEAYFYKQRRGRLGAGVEAGVIEASDLALLSPERELPALRVIVHATAALAQVFPLDLAYYGIAEGAAPDSPVQQRVRSIASALGMPAFELDLVANRIGPCAEVGQPPRLLLPRSIEDTPPREQAFIVGEVAARAAFGFAVGDPRRANAITATLLEYVVWACIDLASSEPRSPHRGRAVYEDIQRRLALAMSPAEQKSLTDTVLGLGGTCPVNGAQLLHAMSRAAWRAGAFLGQDPAIAIALTRQRDGITTRSIDALPESVREVLPFLLSSQHVALRKRMNLGVR